MSWRMGVFAGLFAIAPALVAGQVSGASGGGPPASVPSQTRVIYKAQPEDKVAIQTFLDALDRGDRVEIKFESRNAFRDAWDKTANAWLKSSDSDRERRKQVLAVAILQAGREAVRDGFTWSEIRWLIEWECDQIRRGPPTEFEHVWLSASVVLIQAAGDHVFLEPPSQQEREMKCERLQPCDHAWHALSRFPEDRHFKFAHSVPIISTKPFAREPGEMLRSRRYGTQTFNDRMKKTFEDLRTFADDPVLGPEIRLKLGLLHYALNEREASLRELKAAATSSDEYIRYVAHFVTGLVHEAEGRTSEAMLSYEAALVAMPNVRSGATWLSTKYFLQGRRDEAFDLMDRVYASPPPVDPWHYTDELRQWPNYFEKMREMIRK